MFAGLFSKAMAAVNRLHPAYFALVMATGIVAIAAEFEGLRLLAVILSWFNVFAFIVLWVMTFARLGFYRSNFLRDVADFERGPGFFTLIAGTGVLGSQFVVVLARYSVAAVLWIFTIALWACLIYAIFATFTVEAHKPSLAEGINGGWLVAVVATQAVSNLSTLLAPRFPAQERGMLFFALSMWLVGGMLYIWLISLIFYRYTFFHFSPSDLMPPYWINMGAMAISTLAGTTLIESAPRVPFLPDVLPFLKGFTVFYWATATWWIPMLVILGIWRHVIKKFRLSYDPLYWGAVFPLGMYAASTHRLSEVLELPSLLWLERAFVYISLVAWFAAFTGLVRAVARGAGATSGGTLS